MPRYSHARKGLPTGLLLMLSSLLTACSNLALQAINAPSYLFSDHEVTRSIAYGDAPHQQLDLYAPARNAPSTNALVIFVYGGSWTSGNKESYYFVADALTEHGYSVAIPDYAKYPDAVFPSFVEDVAMAVAWLVENAREYTHYDSIFIMGHSAGAHTGALLVTDPNYLERHQTPVAAIDGFIGLAGPYGFKPREKKFRDIFANLENFDKMRPQHYVTGTEPPVLVMHGNDDTTVLPANSSQFSERINEMGGNAQSTFYPDLGHVDIVLALSRILDRQGVVLNDLLTFMEAVNQQRVARPSQ